MKGKPMIKHVSILALFVCVTGVVRASQVQVHKTVLHRSQAVTDLSEKDVYGKLVVDTGTLLERQEENVDKKEGQEVSKSLWLPPLKPGGVQCKMEPKIGSSQQHIFFPAIHTSTMAILMAMGQNERTRKNSEAEEKKRDEAELFPEDNDRKSVVDLTASSSDSSSGASSVSGDISVSGEGSIEFDDTTSDVHKDEKKS